jgi:MFS family permease
MLIVGRIVSGISVGIASTTIPLYQAEITLPSIRGRLVSVQQWSITWGILIQYFIQFGCSYIGGGASFRIPWGLQAIPAIILSVGMLSFPESPRWLFDHHRCALSATKPVTSPSNTHFLREAEALAVLADLHGNGNPMNDMVQLEFEEIKEQLYFERTVGAKSYFDLLKPGVLHRVSLGASLQMWSQLSGVNLMMYVCVHLPLSSVLIRFQVLCYLRIPGGWPHPPSRQPHC